MSYADNSASFVFVLNSDWQPKWQLHNARGHVAIGLAAHLHEETKLLDYKTPAFNASAHISTWPVIDKMATEQQLADLYNEALALSQANQITLNFFIDSMFGASAEEQLRQTEKAQSPRLLAIGIFGDSKVLRTLTKKLPLATF